MTCTYVPRRICPTPLKEFACTRPALMRSECVQKKKKSRRVVFLLMLRKGRQPRQERSLSCAGPFFPFSHENRLFFFLCERMSMVATTFRYNILQVFPFDLPRRKLSAWCPSKRRGTTVQYSNRGVHSLRLASAFARGGKQVTRERTKKLRKNYAAIILRVWMCVS